MAFRYALPAVAAAGLAAAQCGSGSTTTIQNSGDASAIASCRTYSGSIAIATGTTDDIDFGSLQGISGSLIANEVPKLSSISGSSLQTIGDAFFLKNCQILSTLNFPQLSEVSSIEWIGLAGLSGLSFTTGIQMADSLSIQNTILSSLDGINLREVDSFVVANNPYLEDISMQLETVGTQLSLEANGRQVTADFPNMEWAYNMTIRNVSEINIPSLSSVNTSLGFYSNFFESVSAPNLTVVGSGLSFVANADLDNVTMPELKTIGGGLLIANNTAFEEVTFDSLTRVGGAIDMSGNFTDVSLPELDDVRGAMNIQSSEPINDVCSHFKPLASSNNVIKGPYACAGNRANPRGKGTLADGTSDGSGGNGNNESGASSIYISGAAGVMGVIAAVFGML